VSGRPCARFTRPPSRRNEHSSEAENRDVVNLIGVAEPIDGVEDPSGRRPVAGSGPAHLRRILEFLAVAQASGSTPLDTLIANSTGRAAQQSVVVITPAAPGRWVDTLVQNGDRGRRTTILHLGPEGGGDPRVRLLGEMTWWELGTGGPDPVPLRRAS